MTLLMLRRVRNCRRYYYYYYRHHSFINLLNNVTVRSFTYLHGENRLNYSVYRELNGHTIDDLL